MLCGDLPDDLAHVGEKAHVEHLVRFIEHEHVDAAKVEGALAKVVKQPAGTGDDDLRAAAYAVGLRAHADAAVDRNRVEVASETEIVNRLAGLLRELAGRADDEGARTTARTVHQLLEHRQDECRGLAGARLGQADDIATLKDRGYGFRLNGCRRLKTKPLDVRGQLWRERKGIKVHR